MKYLSICSGIEAASTAWHSLGWEPLAFSEIDPFPCAVLAHHWPHVPNLGDMTKHHDWPNDIRPDLIVGGTPCQAFSVAGLREGLADPRGNLTLTFLSIVAQYRPEWVVWENVPGVLSDKTGAFGAFLGGLGELGYGFAYRVLDAQFLGVAQRRRRVFVVANLTDWRRAAAVLFEQHSLSGDSPPSRSARKGTATGFETGPSSSDEPVFLDRAMFNQGANAQFNPVVRQDGLSDALVARGPHAIAAQMVAFGEYATDDTASTCKQRDYKDATDLVITTQYGEIAGTLTTRHDSSPCADQGQNVVAFSCKDSGNDVGAISPTLRAMGGNIPNGGGQVVVAFERRFVRTSGGQPQDELNPCLRADANTGDGAPCVAMAIPIHDMATRFQGTNGSGQNVGKGHGLGIGPVGDPMFTLTKGDKHSIATNYAVRRLTPTECERLQGFPDDHTKIPSWNGWRNMDADETPEACIEQGLEVKQSKSGKWRVKDADGPRYKAIGNSMAVPVMHWIGQRIELINQATK